MSNKNGPDRLALINLILVFLISGLLIFLSLQSSTFRPALKKLLFPIQATIIAPVTAIASQSQVEFPWLPQPQVLGDKAIKISAQSAFFIDADTGEVLYAQNPEQKLKIASLTKIMTAILALEHRRLDDNYLVSSSAASIMPDKLFLKAGETLSLNELLEGLFLVSANDSAEVLADQTLDSRAHFIEAMNAKARKLGMDNTLFVNPTGLDNDDDHSFSLDGDQYSTAFDVALMSRFAITNWPMLLNITSQPTIHIPQVLSHQAYDLETKISMVKSYPGVIGFKTGYTDEANYTLVTVAQKKDKKVIGVLLNSKAIRDDAKTLLDYSFQKLGII